MKMKNETAGPRSWGLCLYILIIKIMRKEKILTENSIEIAKTYTILKETHKFLDKVFKEIETEDPKGKIEILTTTNVLFGSIMDSVIILQQNNEELIGIERVLNESKN
jgi:hypothetical protein